MKVLGFVEIDIYEHGKLVKSILGKNLVTSAGKNAIAHRLAGDGSPPAPPTHVAFGTDGTDTLESHTTLIAESGVLGRTALTLLRNVNTVTYSSTVVGGVSDVVVKEIGLFNAVAAGTMYARFLPQVFTFKPTMSLVLTWTLTIG